MKVAGFSFVRNAILLDYPIIPAIKSILPLCDEFIIAVGKSEDDTLNLIKSIKDSRIKIIETVWDNNLREGGQVLAEETNKALNEISKDIDWAFYIQADEVMHEKYIPVVKNAMEKYNNDKDVDGLLFNYLHFYASYDYVATSSNWYKHEIRVIKNNKGIYSYKDAQGFRKGNNQKLNVVPIDAYIYHYGWVKHPKTMQLKQQHFHRLWHDDKWLKQNVKQTEAFDYEKHIIKLKHFKDSHPYVMQEYVKNRNWDFNYDISIQKISVKELIKSLLLKTIGTDFSYKNYKIIKK